MLTMNYMYQLNYPIDHVLTRYDKAELIQENKDNDYSYQCLLKEMLSYKHITVNDLFQGWSGVKLFKVSSDNAMKEWHRRNLK